VREKAIQRAVSRLARAVDDVRKLSVETDYFVAASHETGAGTGEARPFATTILRWDANLAEIVATSDEAAPMPYIATETFYAVDPALRRVHQGNVATAPAYWLRLARALQRDE
jgi:hypothetical protein